jgi:protein-disulfide isomerase
MHDLLFEQQDALELEDLHDYARRLDLDVAQFAEDLEARRYALRVARDVESAAASGVAGTPTFFVNGRRHYGAYDPGSLSTAIRRTQVTHQPGSCP